MKKIENSFAVTALFCLLLICKICLIEQDQSCFILSKFIDVRIPAAHRNSCINQFDHKIDQFDILLHHPFGLCHMPRIPLKIHPVSSFYLPSSPKRSFGERINHTFPSISERFTFPISAIRLSSLLSRLSPRTKYSSPPRTIFSLAIPVSAIAVVSYFSFSFLLLI